MSTVCFVVVESPLAKILAKIPSDTSFKVMRKKYTFVIWSYIHAENKFRGLVDSDRNDSQCKQCLRLTLHWGRRVRESFL